MIKLNDFAKQMGVTDRAVQKHLVKYADELDGLYQRKGPNGTWLTDEACEILRSKMRQTPAAIVEPDERVGQLQARVSELEKRLDVKDAMLTASQKTAQEAQNRVQELQDAADKVKRLEGAQKALETERDTYKTASETAGKQLTAAHERERLLIAYAAALERWSSLGWWARRKEPKPVMPELPKEDDHEENHFER